MLKSLLNSSRKRQYKCFSCSVAPSPVKNIPTHDDGRVQLSPAGDLVKLSRFLWGFEVKIHHASSFMSHKLWLIVYDSYRDTVFILCIHNVIQFCIYRIEKKVTVSKGIWKDCFGGFLAILFLRLLLVKLSSKSNLIGRYLSSNQRLIIIFQSIHSVEHYFLNLSWHLLKASYKLNLSYCLLNQWYSIERNLTTTPYFGHFCSRWIWFILRYKC